MKMGNYTNVTREIQGAQNSGFWQEGAARAGLHFVESPFTLAAPVMAGGITGRLVANTAMRYATAANATREALAGVRVVTGLVGESTGFVATSQGIHAATKRYGFPIGVGNDNILMSSSGERSETRGSIGILKSIPGSLAFFSALRLFGTPGQFVASVIPASRSGLAWAAATTHASSIFGLGTVEELQVAAGLAPVMSESLTEAYQRAFFLHGVLHRIGKVVDTDFVRTLDMNLGEQEAYQLLFSLDRGRLTADEFPMVFMASSKRGAGIHSNVFVDGLRSLFERALEESMPLDAVRRKLRELDPLGKVTAFFCDDIGYSVGEDEYEAGLARLFRDRRGVVEAERRVLLISWRRYVRNESVLMDASSWRAGHRSDRIRVRLTRALDKRCEEGRSMRPDSIALGIRDRVARAAFANEIFGVTDVPRRSIEDLAEELSVSTKMLAGWQKYWREQAKIYGWTIKFEIGDKNAAMKATIAQAVMANWEVARLKRELKELAASEPRVRKYLSVFYHLVDWKVLRGRKAVTDIEPTPTEISKALGLHRYSVSTIASVMRELRQMLRPWDNLGGALKRENPHLQRSSIGRDILQIRRDTIARVAAMGQRDPLTLILAYMKVGLHAEAQAVANLVPGWVDLPHTSFGRIDLVGLGKGSRHHLKRAMIDLLVQHGYELKEGVLQ
jgi:hypothetical protein